MFNELYEEFVNWLEIINQSEEIPTDLSAFNFGLFKTENGFVVYLVGSKTYSSKNDDWACKEDFIPKNKYFQLKNINSDKNWREAQSITIEILSRFINSNLFPQSFLSKVKAVTVGFDDGELTRVK